MFLLGDMRVEHAANGIEAACSATAANIMINNP